MEDFRKIVNGFKPLTIFAKSSIFGRVLNTVRHNVTSFITEKASLNIYLIWDLFAFYSKGEDKMVSLQS